MKCVVLVAGHATRLERELREDASGEFSHLVNVPKALLPGAEGSTMLDQWWQALTTARARFSDIYLVVNAANYKHFERWATANGFTRQNIVNDGTTPGTGGIGALADFDLVLRSRHIEEDVLVVAGDMHFNPSSFDLDGILRFAAKKGGNLVCYYQLADEDETSTRGILEVDSDNKVTRFWEKPQPGTTSSRLASVVFYVFNPAALALFKQFASEEAHRGLSFGSFIEWLVAKIDLYGMKLPDHFSLIGAVGLKDYRKLLDSKLPPALATPSQPIVRRAYARVGLIGNPSDGFNGKTISLSIANYWAEASIEPSRRLELTPHPLNDPNCFGSLADLHAISCHEGYQGGLRLMQATCKRFFEHCLEHGIALARRNFRLQYDTNIPRQVGLAGSSAICTSVLKCLMAFFGLTDKDIPKHIQPGFVLSVEVRELGINAGLQDRVIQTYGGLVFMDFAAEVMKRGFGEYQDMDMSRLPQFWLAYLADPSDSGRKHSTVRQRYDIGDKEAIAGMQELADLTVKARGVIEQGDHAKLADLMDQNFAIRRRLYGDEALGKNNLQMIDIAQRHNSAAKFPGSGGAVFGLCRDAAKLPAMRAEFEANNFVFVLLKPCEPSATTGQ